MVNLIKKWRCRPFACGVPTPAVRSASHREAKYCCFCGSVTILGGQALQQQKKMSRFFCDIECAGQYKKWHNRTDEYKHIYSRSAFAKKRAAIRNQREIDKEAKEKLQVGWKCCLWCGIAHKNKSRWCSDKCLRDSKLLNRRELKWFACAGCGDEFLRFTAAIKIKYCSKACSNRASRSSGKAKRRMLESRHCNPGITWLYVANRDGWKCRGCKCRCVKPDGTNRNNEATLDHILPLCSGGKHVKENVQLLCRQCNTNKSGSLKHGQMLLFG